ncbi:ribonuclease E inhibitor RraB [Sphingomonas morindae]|uniref:Ribonuclease E inhibitor RraB n=1 Tax=Sphingomonas morindae TaxID=1541170 RepID=A0ABY4X8D7_9SPHN|nr:ribonuclease E inhibitor RraB [Sphingomonas morindae]USI72936.1 ribonuclease E inhibitor RraB [Sphingomonas morindae]
MQIVALDDGEVAADIQRDQTTDTEALEALTVDALRLELRFSVRYDGWGTVATAD